MNILSTFGLSKGRTSACREIVNGCVTKVTVCYWLKINTKPIRSSAWDGSIYPHMVHFQYTVNGQSYSGKRYWPWRLSPPAVGDVIPDFYDPENAEKWAIHPF